MNESLNNKKFILKELESLIKDRTSNQVVSVDMSLYCEYMKRFYLSCSTNN